MSVTRRKLLEASLAAPLVSTVAACERAATIEPGARIIVVGAGFAGIAAARDLSASGYEVTVLEARDRIGGRAYSDTILGPTIDMGASWLHDGERNPLAALARQSGIAFNVSDYENASIYGQNGVVVPSADVFADVSVDARLEQALFWPYLRWKAGRVFGADGSGRTIGDAWQEAVTGKVAPLNDAAFRLILETQYAAPLGEVAMEELYRGGEALPNNEWYMTGGMQTLVTWLARGLDIRLDTDVRRIAWSGDGATVHTDDAAMTCDGVVLTCSVGVLKSGSIALEPGLPTQHKQALARLEMGLLNKVALRFAAPVWPNDQEFAVLTDGPLPSIVLNHAAYSGQPVLVALTGGHTARLLEEQSAAEVTSALMRTIEGAFGKRLPEPEDYTVWTWGSDPYALGSYAHRRPGANLSEGATLQEPVDGRLFLAGEALAEEKPGTVAGAWLSGRHAAALISGASHPG